MILPIDVILVPQGAEYQAVYRGLKQVKPPHPEVIPIPLGINAVTAYLNQKTRDLAPTTTAKVVLMGLGGSLSPDYQVGNVLIYKSCLLPRHDQGSGFSRLECNGALTNFLDAKLQPKVSLVDSLTTNRVISDRLEKEKLAQIYPAQVVDMEGYAVLSSLGNKSSFSVGIIRIISDDFNHDIPDLSVAIDDYGRLKTFILVKQMLKRPLAAFRLIKGSLFGLKVLENTVINLLS
jgi:nucleoside phosphorylase